MKSSRPNVSIRTRLLMLVMLFVVPFCAIFLWEMTDDVDEARTTGYARVKGLTDITANGLERMLHDNQTVLARLAARSLDIRRCDPVVADYVALYPEFLSLASHDLAGNRVCSYRGLESRAPLGRPPWFDAALRGESHFFGDGDMDPVSGSWNVRITAATLDAAGAPSGLLVMTLNLPALSERLFGAQPADTLAFVLDGQDRFLLHSPGPRPWIGKVSDALPVDDGAEGFFSAKGADGVVRVFAVVTLPGTGWRVVCGVPESELMGAFGAPRNRSLVAGLVVLSFALALALAWRIGSSIVRPVRSLARSAALVADGDASARAPVEGPQDVRQVALQFNRMLDTRATIEAALQESQKNYRELIESSPIGIGVHRGGRFVYVNAAAAKLLGATSVQQLMAVSVLDLVHPDCRAVVRERIHRELTDKTVSPPLDEKYIRFDGTVIDVEVQGTPILYEGLPAARVSFRDITERKLAQAGLQLAASVFSHAREAIMVTDVRGTIIRVNEAFTRITGYSAQEAVGQNPRMLKSGRQSAAHYASMWATLAEQGHWSGEVWNRRKNGEVYAELLTISSVLDAVGQVQNYVALFTDITPMKQHEQRLEHVAHYDALTDLPNRVLLADRLQQAMAQSQRRGQSLAVCYLDLDGFKAVNDSHGHDAGDELLIAIAQRMKASLRECDTLARMGGDEFVAVLVDLERPQDCHPVLERLLQAAADPVRVGSATLQVSASVGVTLYPQDGADADLLMRHADQAMYAAKQAGRNRYHLFDLQHDDAVRTRREGLARLRLALERQEFVLYYQPKVNLETGRVIGAEALIRWQHPERGVLAPADFLPTLEDHPMGVEVGEWVIATALAQMGRWQTAGLYLPVSVNIGARQLQQEGFAQRLGQILADHPDVQPSMLELEVLETSALEDMARVSQVMHACLAIGVRFALDDFGTGYSSLTYLKHLPAEMIKIDQSFVHDMIDDPDDLAIVKGVIGLAAAFGRGVIAEGVETAAHGALLRSIGCVLAQGYGIARPMPAADLPAWVAGWTLKPDWVI